MAEKTVLITGSTRGIGLSSPSISPTLDGKSLGGSQWQQGGRGALCQNLKYRPDPFLTLYLKALSPLKVVSFDCTDELRLLRQHRNSREFPSTCYQQCRHLHGRRPGDHDQGDAHAPVRGEHGGPFLVTRALLPNLKLAAKNNGSDGALVVTVSSQMGSIAGNTHGGNYSYGASKAAVNMINSSLAIDLKNDNIAAIVVHPGYVVTDLTGGLGDVHTDESVRGMTSVIDKVTMADTGKFFHFQGQEMPW
ncbi:NAD(P)-binding domain [Phytophthora cactorum]|nr:NAD(P)-binding domain [Phytophthora cactorum]